MHERDPESRGAWHSPERAWTPLMWIIGGVTLALAAMLFAPLVPLAASLQLLAFVSA
jgi:hypothetical protein